MTTFNRRNFIRTSVMGGAAFAMMRPIQTMAAPFSPDAFPSNVAITSGRNRADMAFRALQPFSARIAAEIGDRRVVLKPNNVSISNPLCATHVDTLEGILEFLKSIGKDKNVIIAESAAGGPTLDGYSNYGYFRLVSKYPVKLVDLDTEPVQLVHVFDQRDFRPHPVRMSGVLLDKNSYVVSVARMKTHDRVLVTLSLKNIVFGAPIKDKGFSWSASRKPGTVNDKPIAHGGGIKGINYNLFALSESLHPNLAVIDGFEGMEGNGPNDGTPVDHRVCVASTDWLAADRVAVELMGVDFSKIGYLTFCANAGRGIADLGKIGIIGESIADHRKQYKLSDNLEEQLSWMNPA